MRELWPLPASSSALALTSGFLSSLVSYRFDLPSGPATSGRAGLPRLAHPQPTR